MIEQGLITEQELCEDVKNKLNKEVKESAIIVNGKKGNEIELSAKDIKMENGKDIESQLAETAKAKKMPVGTDFNTVKIPGLYIMPQTTINSPESSYNYHSLIVLNSTNEEHGQQIAINENTRKIYLRSWKNRIIWTPWVEIITQTGGEFTGIVKANSNTSYNTAQVRNMILSDKDADVSVMKDGDIWIKYK